MNDLVAIARIARPRGLKGEVVADILTDFPERFDALDVVTVLHPDAGRQELKIEKFWFQSGRVILKLSTIDSVESAETLRDAEICVDEAEAVELESDEYFDWQLESCSVETIDGVSLGVVRELLRTGGTEVLVVQGEKEYLIPFASSICVDVDLDNKLIKVDPPEGLLDF